MENEKNVNELVECGEKVGVIGSPSTTTELSIDILGTAVNKKLVGELGIFKYQQENNVNFALGQITEIELKNIWHEDPTMRSLIRQKGTIDPVSEQQDTHLGEMNISAVFSHDSNGFEPSILGTVPPTGTPIQLVDDKILDNILNQYEDQLFYLGRVYGSKPKLPMWFRHFGSGKYGAGEAYHIGVFGKTGSGKSVLSKMMLLGYARHEDMSIFVIDPQGEFTRDFSGKENGEVDFSFKRAIKNSGKRVNTYNIQDLVLDRWPIFENILAGSTFFEKFTFPRTSNKKSVAAEVLKNELKKSDGIKLSNLNERETFDEAINMLQDDSILNRIYTSRSRRQEIIDTIDDRDLDSVYKEDWEPITKLFTKKGRNNAKKIDGILWYALKNDRKPMCIINLADEKAKDLYWNEKIKSLIIKRILDGLSYMAEDLYDEGGKLNSLVVFDEAHRFAPRGKLDDEEKSNIKNKLVDNIRTTRKYGLGWMFISQTLSSLSKDVIDQLRIFFFGFGLSMGTEFQALRELAGGNKNSLDLYKSFRDPQSSFDSESRQFSFMTVGPVSPLSFSGTPLFFNVFNINESDEFLEVNNLK